MSKDRTTLKTYFTAGHIPTEQHFKDLIDSFLHLTEDGLEKADKGWKVQGGQLEIFKSAGQALGPKLVLNNYGAGEGAGGAIDFNGYDVKEHDPTIRIRSLDDGQNSSHLSFLIKEKGYIDKPLVERLRITSDGHVGIGTNSPLAQFQIGKAIDHRNNFSHSDTKLLVNMADTNGGNTPNGTKSILSLVREGVHSEAYGNMADFRIGRYENSETFSRSQLDIFLTDDKFDPKQVMTLRSNGHVGIGLSSPEAQLHVAGTSKFTDKAVFDSGVEMGAGGDAGIVHVKGGLKVDGQLTTEGHDLGKELILGQADAADGKLTVHGKVGIGTNDPQAKLQIEGDLNVGGSGNGRIKVRHIDGKKADADDYDTLYLNWDTEKDVHVGSGNHNANLAVFGKIGIGTESPEAKLDVRGNAYLDNGDTTHIVLKSEEAQTKIWAYSDGKSYFQTKGDLHFDAIDQVSDTPRLYLKNDGNVGIGTAGPAALLHVAGTSKFTGKAVFDSAVDMGATGDDGIVHVKGDLKVDGKLTYEGLDLGNELILGQVETKNGALTIHGNLQIKDGTQAEGKVLTSDSEGNATWKTLSLSEPDIPVQPRYQPGDIAHGGIVVWVDKTGHHGLVIPENFLELVEERTYQWGEVGVDVGCRFDGFQCGMWNTAMMMLKDDGFKMEHATAPFYIIGYADEQKWYIPSMGELDKLKAFFDPQDRGEHPFEGKKLWASVEWDKDNAMAFNFSGNRRTETIRKDEELQLLKMKFF